MKKVTTLWLTCLVVLGFSNLTWAQEREDVMWARFTDEEITIDGMLDEAAWESAEMKEIVWGQRAGDPGSGWFVQAISPNIDDPTDPAEGTVYALAQGDYLYLAFAIQDSSVGGSPGLWNFDGILMPFIDKTEFGPNTEGLRHFAAWDEFMAAWWSPDTTDTGEPLPEVGPRQHSHDDRYGSPGNFKVADSTRTEEQQENWLMATVVNGTTNDDSDIDEGYVMEMRLNMANLGFDLDGPDGDVIGTGFAINDADWFWGDNTDRSATSRAGFQNQWGNFSTGAVRLHTHPSVTVNSGAVPSVEPDVIVANGAEYDAPTVDGVLDEAVWTESGPDIQIQYGNEELMASWPGISPWLSGYWNPNDDPSIPVVEPSIANVKWFFQDDMIYFGIDVDDQSVDTTRGEPGDGLTMTINHRDSLSGQNAFLPVEYRFSIGPDGELRLDLAGIGEVAPGALEYASSLKGATVAGDRETIDEGYQMEIAFDLVEAFGYPEGRGDGFFYFSLHTYDHDLLEDPSRDYAVRTWWSRERGGGVPVTGFMDPNIMVGTASEDFAEIPGRIELHGNYPNPFNPTTTIRYDLPANGEVTLHVFDLLGREVAMLAPGQQTAGRQEIELTADQLASGIYFYRVELEAATEVRASTTGRMILIK